MLVLAPLFMVRSYTVIANLDDGYYPCSHQTNMLKWPSNPNCFSWPLCKAIGIGIHALYLKHRTRISRAVYLTLFVALIHRINNAITEQKAAARRQAELRSHPSTGDGTQPRKRRRSRSIESSFAVYCGYSRSSYPALRARS